MMQHLLVSLLGVLGLLLVSVPGSGAQAGAAKESLVWSDEFNGSPQPSPPDPAKWTYDTGAGGFGNSELETYCAWASNVPPCESAHPSAFVGDGYLHIVARRVAHGFTSARLKTQGRQSFRYGRMEARIKIVEGQGIWPAFWMLGDDIEKAGWPECGELDIMENVGKTPSVVYGSIHLPGADRTGKETLPGGAKLASAFHTYGMIWAPGRVQFYLDSPDNVYATYIPADLPKGAVWPFDGGQFFILLNLAVGGRWPGNPDATTRFPQEMLVDYVRVYAERASYPPQ